MSHPTGNRNGKSDIVQDPAVDGTVERERVFDLPAGNNKDVATRAKQRATEQIKQNRFVLIAAGSIVAALLVFAAVSAPRRNTIQKPKTAASANGGATTLGEGSA